MPKWQHWSGKKNLCSDSPVFQILHIITVLTGLPLLAVMNRTDINQFLKCSDDSMLQLILMELTQQLRLFLLSCQLRLQSPHIFTWGRKSSSFRNILLMHKPRNKVILIVHVLSCTETHFQSRSIKYRKMFHKLALGINVICMKNFM